MYHNRIDLILTFLGLFLITNVFGAPGASSLAKNQTSTSKATTIKLPEKKSNFDIRSLFTKKIAFHGGSKSSDQPNNGELDFFYVQHMDFDLNFET